jgi:hypothetical protein
MNFIGGAERNLQALIFEQPSLYLNSQTKEVLQIALRDPRKLMWDAQDAFLERKSVLFGPFLVIFDLLQDPGHLTG